VDHTELVKSNNFKIILKWYLFSVI
jgi:hypothetical protein